MKNIAILAFASVLFFLPSCRQGKTCTGVIDEFVADSVYLYCDSEDDSDDLPLIGYKISNRDKKKVEIGDYIRFKLDKDNVLHSPKVIYHVVTGTVTNSSPTSIAVISTNEGTLVIDMPDKPSEDFSRFKDGDFVIITCDKKMEKGKLRYLATSLGVLGTGKDADSGLAEKETDTDVK